MLPGIDALVVHNTDSVFVEMGAEQRDVDAERMAAAINKTFPPPISLEYEKTYRPLLLVGRKMYAGMKEEDGSASFAASGCTAVAPTTFRCLRRRKKMC